MIRPKLQSQKLFIVLLFDTFSAGLFPGPVQACAPSKSQVMFPGRTDVCPSMSLYSCLKTGDGNESIPMLFELTSGEAGEPVEDLDRDGAPEAQGKEPDTSTIVYEVKGSPGKGLGVFAVKFLPRGTPIIIEAPLVSIPMPEMVQGQGFRLADMISHLEEAFQDLTAEQKDVYLSLHNFRFPSEGKQNKLLTLFRSNAYNTGDKHIGLFPKIARINHSCRPNSGNHWSENTGLRIIYASRNIEKGEEITVSYIPLLKTIKERQSRLQQYGFTCDCEACQSAAGDKKRMKILDLTNSLEQKVSSPSTKDKTNEKMISKSLSLVNMIEEEGLMDYLAHAFHFAAVFNQRRGQLHEAISWAEKELEIQRLAEIDSPEALTALELVENLRRENS